VDGIPQIFLLNVDGTGMQQLTTLPDGACQPDFSPDGSQMVFISPCPGNQESYSNSGLLIINLDTLEPQPLVTTLGGDYDPVWSPAGGEIAFTSERDGRPQLFLIDLETTEISKLSDQATLDRQPSWDPLGEQLVFASTRTGESQIWLMGALGEESSRYSFSDEPDSHPSWSHDGQIIVYQRRLGGIPRLVGTRFEDRGLRDFRICTQGPLSTQPMAEARWSLDDRWIVFETWPDGVNHNIGMVSANCTNFVNLTEDPAYDFDPTWRP
jgi:Tol biopolymer transport system component